MVDDKVSLDDVQSGLTDAVARPMLELILAFARLDTALSAWLIQAYGMPLDRGALLVENMDIGNKINRLKKIFAHDKDTVTVQVLTKLKGEFEKKKNARNFVAHATFAGTLKANPDVAVFSPVRTGTLAGHLAIYMIPIAHMRDCSRWAVSAAETVIQIFEERDGPIQRLN